MSAKSLVQSLATLAQQCQHGHTDYVDTVMACCLTIYGHYILYNIYGHYTLTMRTQQWLGGHQRELLHVVLSCIWGPGTVEYFDQKQGSSTISWHFSLLMKTMINRNFNSGILLQQPRPGAVQLLPCDSSQSSSITWTLLLDSSFLSYFFQLNRVLPNCMTKLNVFQRDKNKTRKKFEF